MVAWQGQGRVILGERGAMGRRLLLVVIHTVGSKPCCEKAFKLLLQQIIEDPLMRHSALLVFANKQDLVSAVPAVQCNRLVCFMKHSYMQA